MLIIANLDAEAELAGQTLSAGAMRTVASLGTLLRGMATAEEDRVWTPLPVDAARVPDLPGRPNARLVSGPLHPPADEPWIPWARTPAVDPIAGEILRTVAHRRFALEVGKAIDQNLPGSAIVDSPAALRRHLRAGGADLAPEGRWVLKAPFTAAGRWRLRESADDAAIERFFGRFGEGLFEPWLPRVADGGVAAEVHLGGDLTLIGRHDQLVDGQGRFIAVRPGDAPTAEEARVTEAVGRALHDSGFVGPFGIDTWIGRDRAGRRVERLLGEINPRLTMGRVARSLVDVGETMHLGREVPPGARALLHPSCDDATAAWIDPK